MLQVQAGRNFDIGQIPPDQIEQVWSWVEACLGKCEKFDRGYLDLYQLKRDLQSGSRQLFVIGDMEGWIVSLITSIEDRTDRRVLVVEFLGGVSGYIPSWIEVADKALQDYARYVGASEIEISRGRQGWEKFGKMLGYETVSITLVREL